VADDGRGANDEQSAQVSVSLFRDAAKPGLAAGRVLLWRQPEPCGELPCRTELVGIGDGCRDSGRGDHTDSGDRCQPSARLVLGMPGDQAPFELRDLMAERDDLADQCLQGDPRMDRQRIRLGESLLSALGKVGDPRVCDDTQFRQMPAQRIGQHRTLSDEQRSGPVRHEDGLLFDRLDRHESHGRALDRLANRFSVKRVALASLDEGLHVGRRDQAYVMSHGDPRARPVVRGATSFHADQTGGELREKRNHLLAMQPFDQHRSPVPVDAMYMEHTLRQIQPNRLDHHRRHSSLCFW